MKLVEEIGAGRLRFTEAAEKKGLNPAIWSGDHPKPEVRENLLRIARDFLDGLKTHTFPPTDIILTGSNANFNWGPGSDLDLHLVGDLSKVDNDKEFATEYFNDLTFIWNEHHDVEIHGAKVELYVQDKTAPLYAGGIYSLTKREWVRKPKHVEEPDPKYIELKARPIMRKIDALLRASGTADPGALYKKLDALRERIKDGRKSALAKGGEQAVGNLVFKLLRKRGFIDRLITASRQAYDRALSLSEHAVARELRCVIGEISSWE